jgi:hypothetical protein
VASKFILDEFIKSGSSDRKLLSMVRKYLEDAQNELIMFKNERTID